MNLRRRAEEALRSARWRGPAILVLLASVLLLPYHGVVFRGESLVYTDNYNPVDDRWHGPDAFAEDLWSKRGLTPSSNFHDPGATWWQWEPGGQFLRRAIERREWPWWDPYVAGGAPAMANLTQAFFFPPYLALVGLGNGAMLKNFYFLLLLFQAGGCSYLLLRRHGLSVAASFGGAVGVMLCGGLNRNVGSFVGQTAACLPFLLCLTHWALRRASFGASALLGGGFALVALASFPPLLVANFTCVSIYAALQVLHSGPGLRRRRVYLFATSAALGLGLVAFCYAPAFVAIESAPQVTGYYASVGLVGEPWGTLVGLVSPVAAPAAVFGDPPFEDEIGPAAMPYVGLGVLMLVLAGVRRWKGHAMILWWSVCIASAMFVLKFLGVEPLNQLARLPGLRRIHYDYFDISVSTLLPLLAAFGVERIRNGGMRWSTIGLLISAGGGCLSFLLWEALRRGLMAHALRWEWIRYWIVMLSVWAALSLIVVVLRGDGRARLARFAAWGAVLLLAAEGTYNNRFPHQHVWDVWRHPTPAVVALMGNAEQERTYDVGTFPPNLGSAFEVAQLESLMTVNPPRIFQLYQRYAASDSPLFMHGASEIPPDPVLDAANVRTVNIRNGLQQLAEAERRGYRLVQNDGRMTTWQRDSEPRHYFTTRYRAVGEATLEAVAARAPRELILSADPGLPDAGAPGPTFPVELVDWGRNGYTLRVLAPRPGLVYSSESYFSGWTARVNGRPVEILPANHAFRAVVVPGGESTVEYAYWPPGLSAGLALSSVSALAGLALVVGSWRPR